MSQTKSAAMLAVSVRTLRHWEAGKTPLAIHFPKIIEFLGRDPWSEAAVAQSPLRCARLRRGLSIDQGALELAVEPSTLWWWEHGRKPQKGARQRIARFISPSLGEEPVAYPTGVPGDVEAPRDLPPIGGVLRQRRQDLGLSLEAAASSLTVSLWTLLRWEQDRALPAARYFPTLIRFLEKDPWPFPETEGSRLRAERLRRGLTYKQAGMLIGVDPGALAHWEAGKRPRHAAAKAKIEAFLTGAPRPTRTGKERSRPLRTSGR